MRTKFGRTSNRHQEGSTVIIVMMFILVFLIIGTALVVLVRSSNAGTALERKDIKAFNVAEAGVDAAMAELRSVWPILPNAPAVVVDPEAFRSIYADSTQFPDPSHGEFIYAVTYDNTPDNPTSDATIRVIYDANGDDKMWVDSEADVDDARHRILLLVKRVKLPLGIPDVALVANTAGGNGQGLAVDVDPAYLSSGGSIPGEGAAVVYTGKGDLKKDVSIGAYVELSVEEANPFSDYVSDDLIELLKGMAQDAKPCSLFSNADYGQEASEKASEFLCGEDGPGSVVYVESDEDPIVIGGNTPMGTPEKPVLLVVDTLNSGNAIDWRGTAQFYGVVIVVGDVELRGTMDISGCVLSNGAVINEGGPGIKYNGDYIRRVNGQYTLSVAMVPNTWEEYTVPKTSTTVAGP